MGVVDMGAQYIHGEVGNPVYEIAKKLNNVVTYDDNQEDDTRSSSLSSSSSSDEEEDFWFKNCSFYTSDGKLLDTPTVLEAHNAIELILEECNKFSRDNYPNAMSDSVGTYVHREFFKYLRTSNDSSDVKSIKESIFNWRLLFENTDNACASIYELSLFAWGEFIECAGDTEVELRNGYKPIVDEFVKSIPTEKILLNTSVKAIFWDTQTCPLPAPRTKNPNDKVSNNLVLKNDPNSATDSSPHKVVLITEDGTTITADHVVVTCPLGYLKRHVHSLFKPLLPSDKVNAIHRLGFGTVDKIYLEFPEPFWDKDCEGICFAWMPEEKFTLNCVENKHYSEYVHHDWYRSVWGFHPVAGHQRLLVGWIAADEARIMETVREHVVRDICHELLQRFTGDFSIPKPTRIMRSCWYSDPYSWGSYTYIKDGTTAEACNTLARPLPSEQMPALLFAGEATHKTYFSTVHGALLSGQREADRVLNYLHNKP